MITLIAQPSAVLSVRPEIRYSLRMNDVSSGLILKSMKYRLLNNTTAKPMTSFEVVRGNENEVFTLDFSSTVIHHLATLPIFDSGDGALRTCTEMLVSISLEYSEIEFNTDTCQTSISTTVITDARIVVNRGYDWFNAQEFLGNKVDLLSYKGPRIEVTKNTFDYLYVYAKTAYTIGGVKYNQAGGVIGDIGPWTGSANVVTQWGVGPKNHTIGDNTSRISMYVLDNSKALVASWDYLITCYDNPVDILFQQVEGGYSVITFDRNIQSIVNSGQISNRARTISVKGRELTRGGNTNINVSSYDYYQLIKTVDDNDIQQLNYYRSLFQTGSCYMRVPKSDGTLYWVKALITPGDWIINKEDKLVNINLRIRLNLPTEMPNYTT